MSNHLINNNKSNKLIIGIVLILISAIFYIVAEIIFPISLSVDFNIIDMSKEVVTYRKRIKEFKIELVKKDEYLVNLDKEIAGLETIPKVEHLIVDLLRNQLFYKQGEEIIKEFIVSTGKDSTLIYQGRQWMFKTPSGVLRILKKIKDPVWYKPDWAFIEENKLIPPRDSKERLIRGVLGDFALDLGGGIFIHGTSYENLLGRSVTHGCIRVGKDDLKFLYENCQLNTKVYIYGK
jgi:L,D-transpeptidase YbiS